MPERIINPLLEDFRHIRRCGTPWCAIRTPDYRATMFALLRHEAEYDVASGNKRKIEKLPKAIVWDCVSGPKTPVVDSDGKPISQPVTSSIGSEEDAPFAILKNSAALDGDAILFVIVTANGLLENPFVAQAISNLREVFKGRGCTLVLLGPVIKLPMLISEDIPILDDPLPDVAELREVCEYVLAAKNAALEAEEKKPLDLTDEEMDRAAGICLGMTRFATEEGLSRKMTDTGIDFKTLTLLQRSVIEASSDNSLKFETMPWTFKDMGGAANWCDFMRKIYNGPRRYKLVVRVDEIDKMVTAASTGTVADNTGVSQDLLRNLLVTIEDNDHLAMLSVGPPGTGKTLSSIAAGNEFGARTMSFDMGAVKGSLVGESEARMRRVMQIIRAIGGQDVLWIATANRLDTLPPELQARFWLGTWFWDLPNPEERTFIWGIQRKRYNIPAKDKIPNDDGWVGRDIRNCCRMAFMCKCSLEDASNFVTITGTVNKAEIEKSRDQAQLKAYLSASVPGPYRRPEQRTRARMMKG